MAFSKDDDGKHALSDDVYTLTKTRKHSVLAAVSLILGDVCLIIAFIAASFVVWQTTWTGVQSAQTQAQQSKDANWSTPSVKPAKAQSGEPPVLDSPAYGELLGQLYIPRFGAKWQRNIVQGTDSKQLARHGLGHYMGSQMPGAVGLFAVAGHRAGYGEPLAYINTLQNGDPIVIRTQDYWYVYTYYDHAVVNYTQNEAIASVPFHPSETPTERLMALSSCEPRYFVGGATPNRWVAYARFKYWAKTSDGTPEELLSAPRTGDTKFTIGSGEIVDVIASKTPDLRSLLKRVALAYAGVYIAAAIAWGWPQMKKWWVDYRLGIAYSGPLTWIWRLQPGPKLIRLVLDFMLMTIAFIALLQWACPWAASNIPWIAAGASYTTIS